MQAWFGLRRPNYFLDPRNNPEDRKFYASRPNTLDIQKQTTGVEIDLEESVSPKKIYWGPYGSGKTHTLYKVLDELEQRLPIYVAFVECPVLKKNSTFVALYSQTMDVLGMEFVTTLLRDALNKVTKEMGFPDALEVEKRLIQMMGDEDLGRATYSYLTQRLDPMKIWRWITAAGISTRERDELRVRDDLGSADPTRLVGILVTLGRLLRLIKNRSLVLVFDELDRAKDLGDEAVSTFSTAFTRITDPGQTDVAVFFSLSAARIDQESAAALTDPVRGRVGRSNIVPIPSMSPDDVLPFVRGLIGYVRDPGVSVKAELQKYRAETPEGEDVTEDLYPFTRAAVEAIKSANPSLIVPREICHLMGRSAAYAKLRGKHVVGAKDVESASAAAS